MILEHLILIFANVNSKGHLATAQKNFDLLERLKNIKFK